MVNEYKELQRLAKMLEEGEISAVEYERLRAELYDDVASRDDPADADTEAIEPGWYYDPTGVASHQAYWDGEKWTGATRPGPAQIGQPTKSSRSLVGVSVAVGAAIVLIVILAVVVVQFAGSAVSETFSEIGSSLDAAGDSYGSDPGMDMLYDGCSEGSNADCDMLWLISPIGSEYEDVSIVCGGRSEALDQTSTSCIATRGTFSEVDDLRAQCEGGFNAACDALYYISEIGSDDETLAMTCGGRAEADAVTSCWRVYGFGTRD